MRIYYVNGKGNQSDGDIKVLKNGAVFIRKQRIYDGCYVVSNGKPSYEWYGLYNTKVNHLITKIVNGDIKFLVKIKPSVFQRCTLKQLQRDDVALRALI